MAKESQAEGPQKDGEMREFLFVLRRALLMIVQWIERKYGLRREDDSQ